MALRREINESDEPEDDEESESDAGADDASADDADASEDDGGEEESTARSRRARRKAMGRGRTRMQRLKASFRDVRLEVYSVFFVAGVVLLIFGIAAYFAQGILGSAMAGWFRSLGGAAVAFFLGTLAVFGVAAYLLAGLMTKRNEFLGLVRTRAKSDFVRNLDKIERLAFELGTKESDIVARKKREFKIRH